MSYCSECGSKNEAGAGFCGNCGATIAMQQASSLIKPKTGNLPVKIVIASVLVLFLTVAAYTALAKNNVLLASSPESVAKDFIEGVIKGDKSVSRLCVGNEVDQAWNMGVMALGLSMTKDRNFTYKTTKKTGTKAVVEVSGKSGHLCYIELENVKGKWLVSYVQ